MTQNDAQNNVYINDVDDTSSEITVDSDDEYVGSNVVQSQYQNSSNESRISANLNLPTPNLPNKSSISHISSVALQNSTDITFGNKYLYNGPITLNQYGIENNLSKKSLLFLNRWKIVVTSSVMVVIILIIIATILATHFRNRDPDIPTYEMDNSPLTLVTRDKWGAKPPRGILDDLETPVSRVIIQHTVQPRCYTMDSCELLVRQTQTTSMAYSFDIAYNFLVGGDGAAYEGRGWNKVGAHTKGSNYGTIGIAFIGDFRAEQPPKKQVIAMLKLLREGVQQGKISQNYTLIGANQVQPTESPGKMLIKILETLPHWSDNV